MDASVRIRRGTLDDIPVITRHRLGMMSEMGFGTPSQFAMYEKDFQEFVRKEISVGNFQSWLAETEAGQVVGGGAVYIVPWPGNPVDRLQKRVFILNVFTDPEFRRRGVARTVVNAMVAWCRAQGFRSVRLMASDFGRPLYASLGFYATHEMKLDL
jgi:GNAT superfamily N-acetyltransferase